MASQNKRAMVESRWRELQPGWGPKEHDAERQMLRDALDDEESIEALVGCVWGPQDAFRDRANQWDRMRQYDGIAVLTNRRIVMLKKKGMNKLITEMPLQNLESIDVDADGRVTLTGRSYSDWVGHGDPRAFAMRDVQDGHAQSFAEQVGEVKASPPSSTIPVWSATPSGAALSAGDHSGITKVDRINAQWRERSAMWSRNSPGISERLMAGLMSFFTGENLTTYPGELRILHEVLEDDENIE